ncbi:family 2A encapsulin nanocompartment cargo protein cysteine desulfurase [Mucilaginibacter paludis]|uniref:cysteine desulfurase n=1 Tax=Mucilaginibacter paludis DSM 18603 TaxID=714943 RepID=H1Y729_9SPHI|nr:family 2A encapsulin nanocompartment cargo protein cysteine desulfurase [Mucilaginibacter paludis]EHQ28648.1 cysteine desulfurase, SufS subfamily [Mucilaginibacter paludis DSM 18603]
MSTNINAEEQPDLSALANLANQFFKALPGQQIKTDPVVGQAHEPVRQDALVESYEPWLYDQGLRNNSFDHSPPSASGVGVSPSAANQNNAVDLRNPQTSFADPNLAGPKPADSVQLPFQEDEPFETRLKEILNNVRVSSPAVRIPFDQDTDAPYYFLKNRNGVLNPKNIFDRDASRVGQPIAPPFDVNLVRNDFPILRERVNGRPLIWLDNAATTQKPQQVIDRISYFYQHENSNIHRAAHQLAARATDAYEGAREKVRAFINAASVNEIIFVRGATEAINLVAKSWSEQNLNAGDEIIVSHLEHHANIVPWQQLAAKKGLKIKVIPVDDDGQILLDEYAKLLGPKTKLVAFTQVSNALGTVTPASRITELAHQAGAKVLIDGAQSVSHMKVDVRALDADWFVFSGHKVFGPTGIGVVYGKEALLNETQPWQGGGNMISDVTFEYTQYHKAPSRFEAGTGNIADAVGLGAAIDYVSRIGIENISRYEHYLLIYATRLLKEVPGIRLIGTAPDKASVLSFVLAGYKTEEIGAALNKEGIAVRSGHHCAQPILRRFGVESTVRPSLAFYNTRAEIDTLVNILHRLKK